MNQYDKKKLLNYIDAVSFALIDTNLYLDTHPNDKKAMDHFNQYQKARIEEQLSINQPPGIRAAFEAACAQRGERHAALHDALECLGEMMFNAQRNGTPPDALAYVGCLKRKAGIG